MYFGSSTLGRYLYIFLINLQSLCQQSLIIGVELYRHGLKFELNELNLSGVVWGDPPQTPIKSIGAELNSNSAEMNFTEVARGERASTQGH